MSINDTGDHFYPFRQMASSDSSMATVPSFNAQLKEPPNPAASQSTDAAVHGSSYTADIFHHFHQHKISDSTATSSDSSPTTTASTVDDRSSIEASPGSSPESPPPTTFAVGMLRSDMSNDERPFFELQKQQPPKKERNLKNLAVKTARQTGRAVSAAASLPQPSPAVAAASNNNDGTTFVRPPGPIKRKSNHLGLTLLTPGSGKFPPQNAAIIPPTPSLTRPATLRHFQSSPSLPLVSSGFGHHTLHTTMETIMSPVDKAPVKAPSALAAEQNFDVPLSREEKPEAYPDGPICVYDPYIDLYLEPTTEQARQYDVIMNVAVEVRNPFISTIQPPVDESEIRIDGGGGIQFAPKRDRAFASRQSAEGSSVSSPSTPIASPLAVSFHDNAMPLPLARDPEYMHIPWEHNSDIVRDLMRLCKVLDDKVVQGKRVLVHCQCGVSRSASLVVAYGIYKNPSMSVQEAYDAVKAKSKWIGPNMNLIMQLQEFRSSLLRGLRTDARGVTPITPASALSEWGSPVTGSLAGGRPHPTSLSTVSSLPFRTAAPEVSQMTPCGPSSAPSGEPWSLETIPLAPSARVDDVVKPGTAYIDPSGKVVAVGPTLNIAEPSALGLQLEVPDEVARQEADANDADAATPTAGTLSPRSDQFAMAALHPSPEVQSMDDFGLMSPSSNEFSSSPFDRSALLAQLGMGLTNQPDEEPRRSKSVRYPGVAVGHPTAGPNLRTKISSPTLGEQRQLQNLQTKVTASLPHRRAGLALNFSNSDPATSSLGSAADRTPTATSSGLADLDEALMSPRATEFTQNPFALALESPSEPNDGGDAAETGHDGAAMRVAQGEPNHARAGTVDPRSPAYKGGSPITRSIFDVL